MERTWKPTVAGILAIIAGLLELLAGMALLVGLGLLGSMAGMIPGFPGGLLALFAVPVMILGIVAIAGGIYSLRRKIWGLALAGCICSYPIWLLGIPALIFVSLGKGEFE